MFSKFDTTGNFISSKAKLFLELFVEIFFPKLEKNKKNFELMGFFRWTVFETSKSLSK